MESIQTNKLEPVQGALRAGHTGVNGTVRNEPLFKATSSHTKFLRKHFSL